MTPGLLGTCDQGLEVSAFLSLGSLRSTVKRVFFGVNALGPAQTAARRKPLFWKTQTSVPQSALKIATPGNGSGFGVPSDLIVILCSTF